MAGPVLLHSAQLCTCQKASLVPVGPRHSHRRDPQWSRPAPSAGPAPAPSLPLPPCPHGPSTGDLRDLYITTMGKLRKVFGGPEPFIGGIIASDEDEAAAAEAEREAAARRAGVRRRRGSWAVGHGAHDWARPAPVSGGVLTAPACSAQRSVLLHAARRPCLAAAVPRQLAVAPLLPTPGLPHGCSCPPSTPCQSSGG